MPAVTAAPKYRALCAAEVPGVGAARPMPMAAALVLTTPAAFAASDTNRRRVGMNLAFMTGDLSTEYGVSAYGIGAVKRAQPPGRAVVVPAGARSAPPLAERLRPGGRRMGTPEVQ